MTLDLSVTDRPAALHDLADDWQALWRAAGGRFGESPAAAQLAWTHVAEPAGARLAVLTGRRSGQLALILPMMVRRRGPLRVMRPLGPGAAECTGWLLDPQLDLLLDPSAELAGAWRLLARSAGADIAQLPAVVAGSTLHTVLAEQPDSVVTGTDVLPVVRPEPEESFAQYSAKLGKLNHNRPGVLRKRLTRAGTLDIAVQEPGDASAPALVDWLLELKREWALRAGKDGPWLTDPGYREFLVASLRSGIARLLVVRVDGEPVAAAVLGVGESLVEGLINAYDPEYARWSPGLVVVEACVEWALGQGLGIDLGVGSEAYKQYWSRGEADDLLHLRVPTGLRGRLVARAGLRRRTPGSTGGSGRTPAGRTGP